MDVDVNERLAQLEDLNKYIEDSGRKLMSIINFLGWDVDKLLETREMVTCPINKEHSVPKDRLDIHLAKCSWKMEGYHEEDVPLPKSSMNDTSTIVIDKELRTKIIHEAAALDPNLKTGIPLVGLDDRPVPKTGDRIVSDFTPDERRIMYDYAVSNTGGAAQVMKVEEFNMPLQKEEKQRPKTFIERLAEERDAKRRKVSKKVHTNRKSHTEILREVILNQMEMFEDCIKQENEGEHGSDTSQKSRESNNYDYELKCTPGPSRSLDDVPGSSRSNFNLPSRERNREGREQQRRREGSRSPGSSSLRYEESRRTEENKRQERLDYAGSSYRDGHSKRYYEGDSYEYKEDRSRKKYMHDRREERDTNEYQEEQYRKYETRERPNGCDSYGKRKDHERSSSFDSRNKSRYHDMSDRKKYQSKRKHRERTKSSDSEEDTKTRARSSSYESQNRSKHRERSYSDDSRKERRGRSKSKHLSPETVSSKYVEKKSKHSGKYRSDVGAVKMRKSKKTDMHREGRSSSRKEKRSKEMRRRDRTTSESSSDGEDCLYQEKISKVASQYKDDSYQDDSRSGYNYKRDKHGSKHDRRSADLCSEENKKHSSKYKKRRKDKNSYLSKSKSKYRGSSSISHSKEGREFRQSDDRYRKTSLTRDRNGSSESEVEIKREEGTSSQESDSELRIQNTEQKISQQWRNVEIKEEKDTSPKENTSDDFSC